MASHQFSRVSGWLRQDDPDVAMNEGYQLMTGKMLLAAGGVDGVSAREMVQFDLPPDSHTDFAFTVIGARFGLLGCGGVLLLYIAIFVCGLAISLRTYDPFGRLLAVGIVGLLFSQVVVNVGMTVGLFPITGMTLPLVSYGGSSLLVNCAALGLLVNVANHPTMRIGPRPFEHGEKRRVEPPAVRIFREKYGR
jgi:cell division protein FtsW (lipid II flippase)